MVESGSVHWAPIHRKSGLFLDTDSRRSTCLFKYHCPHVLANVAMPSHIGDYLRSYDLLFQRKCTAIIDLLCSPRQSPTISANDRFLLSLLATHHQKTATCLDGVAYNIDSCTS